MEKKLVENEGTFGTGDPRRVAAPEAGNNAAVMGVLLPILFGRVLKARMKHMKKDEEGATID